MGLSERRRGGHDCFYRVFSGEKGRDETAEGATRKKGRAESSRSISSHTSLELLSFHGTLLDTLSSLSVKLKPPSEGFGDEENGSNEITIRYLPLDWSY